MELGGVRKISDRPIQGCTGHSNLCTCHSHFIVPLSHVQLPQHPVYHINFEVAMSDSLRKASMIKPNRRTFIGGSDARIIMGSDEIALVRLWREKRGEAEPKDLSGNLIVQLGVATEELNRRWYEAHYRTGYHGRAAARQTPGTKVDGGHPGRAC